MGKLTFELFSGGTIEIELEKCLSCPEKPCIAACTRPAINGPLRSGVNGLPLLGQTMEQIKRGGCSECLGCELDCALEGRQAVKIILPIAGLDTSILAEGGKFDGNFD